MRKEQYVGYYEVDEDMWREDRESAIDIARNGMHGSIEQQVKNLTGIQSIDITEVTMLEAMNDKALLAAYNNVRLKGRVLVTATATVLVGRENDDRSS